MSQNNLNLLFNFWFVYHKIIGGEGVGQKQIGVKPFFIQLDFIEDILFFSQLIEGTLIFYFFDEYLC